MRLRAPLEKRRVFTCFRLSKARQVSDDFLCFGRFSTAYVNCEEGLPRLEGRFSPTVGLRVLSSDTASAEGQGSLHAALRSRLANDRARRVGGADFSDPNERISR